MDSTGFYPIPQDSRPAHSNLLAGHGSKAPHIIEIASKPTKQLVDTDQLSEAEYD